MPAVGSSIELGDLRGAAVRAGERGVVGGSDRVGVPVGRDRPRRALDRLPLGPDKGGIGNRPHPRLRPVD